MLQFDKNILQAFADHGSDPVFMTSARQNVVEAVATAGAAPEVPQA